MTSAPRTYEIHETALLTGLAPARLRAWERRHAVVRPERQPNGYRAYTAAQVALLRAMAVLVRDGARIGDLVALPPVDVIARARVGSSDGSPLGELLAAVRAQDRDALDALIQRGIAERGAVAFAAEIVLPFAQLLGDLWAVGDVPIVSEHLASEAMVQALKGSLRAGPREGPRLVAAGLPGERHEWGFLATLLAIQARGWTVDYLGPDLPLDEAVRAVWQVGAAGLVLSVSDVTRCVEAGGALDALPARLPEGVFAAIGGAGIRGREAHLRRVGYRLDPAEFDAIDAAP